MTEPQIAIVTCVPVEIDPDFPARANYSTYEVVPCPDCGQDMWLGERGKRAVEAGARMQCMFCTVKEVAVSRMKVMLLNMSGPKQ